MYIGQVELNNYTEMKSIFLDDVIKAYELAIYSGQRTMSIPFPYQVVMAT
jgi:hypothetical protein